MSLLNSLAAPLRLSARMVLQARMTAVAGPSSVAQSTRSFATTSLCREERNGTKKEVPSTYSAILESLEASLEANGMEKNGMKPRLKRPSDGRRNYVDDLEAEWASRAIFGEQSWPHTPYSGRSISVNNISDVSRAYNQLGSLLGRNNVRRELKLRERFEKPNEERSRKKSERHRRRFADLVRRKVQMVMAIKARGA